jgi:CubicO group peptidase (beta-lactamase class C family)
MTTTSTETHLYGLPIVDRMREGRVPGVSIAIVSGGEITETSTYGVREAGRDDEVTTQTRFQACSISKPVTCLAMLRLVEQGRVDLDADVNESLQDWRVPANGSWQPRVTLRQLASHSAGLTAHGFPGYPRGATLPTLPQILSGISPANTEGVRVDIVPGVQFRYSGGGTTVMQLLLEQVTGEPIADLIRSLVLEPLGMEHSTYEQPLPEALHEQAAVAHASDGRPIEGGWHVYPEQSAAGLWTTPSDLCRFALAVSRAALGEPGSLISQETAAEMLTPQTPPSEGAERVGGLNAVGIGPFVRIMDGETTYFGHSGGNEGFRCHLLMRRDGSRGACVMTNADGGTPLIINAVDAIAAQHGWDGYSTEPLGELPPRGSALDTFVGEFETPSGVPVRVSRDGERLDVRIGSQPVLPFFANDATTIGCQLVDATLKTSEGGLVMSQSGTETRCTRVDG